MRRGFVLCLALLALLLALCLLSVLYVSRSAAALTDSLPALGRAAQAGQWDEAQRCFAECDGQWQQTEKRWRALINHDDMRDIEVALVDLEVALEAQEMLEVQKELADLEFFIRHVPLTERVEWGNVF